MSNIVAQEAVYPVIRGDDGSLLSPPTSPRRPPVSPPPSSSMLKLQQLGLELGPSRSTPSLQARSYNSSIRSTPSDLDKPLPLEPPEIDRRASSVYSVETTISNILDLYGGHRFEEEACIVTAQRVQTYRDTVAPLMARRYSGAESPPPLPLTFKRMLGAESPQALSRCAHDNGGGDNDSAILPSMPSPSIYQDYTPPMSPDVPDVPPLSMPAPSIYPEMSPPISPAESKNAPSFAEFARNLPPKPFDVISPLSADGSERYHRQMAMDALAPPSPHESPNMHPVAFEGRDTYLPGPMSGTITNVVVRDQMPSPLNLSRASRSVHPPDLAKRTQIEHNHDSFEDFLQQSARKNSSITSSRDKFSHSPPSFTHEGNEILSSQRFTEDEKCRIMSYASEKYPGMKAASQQKPKRMSTRSSLSKRASSLMRAMSVRKEGIESSTGHKTSESTDVNEYVPGRKNLAIQPTSYQLYGEAAWEKDDKKRRWKDERRSKDSNTTADDEKMGFFEGAKHKLRRTASEKKREKLKASIKLVGTTEITKEKHAREDPRRWWQ